MIEWERPDNKPTEVEISREKLSFPQENIPYRKHSLESIKEVNIKYLQNNKDETFKQIKHISSSLKLNGRSNLTPLELTTTFLRCTYYNFSYKLALEFLKKKNPEGYDNFMFLYDYSSGMALVLEPLEKFINHQRVIAVEKNFEEPARTENESLEDSPQEIDLFLKRQKQMYDCRSIFENDQSEFSFIDETLKEIKERKHLLLSQKLVPEFVTIGAELIGKAYKIVFPIAEIAPRISHN